MSFAATPRDALRRKRAAISGGTVAQHLIARIDRRALLALLGAAAATLPRRSRAQQGSTIKRLGVLMPTSEDDPETEQLGAEFRRALGRFGWTGGRNIRFDYRWGAGDQRRIDALALQLVAAAPDAIFAGGAPAVAPLKRATSTIPIVFVSASDPVDEGFVTDLAHPGGNITGFANFAPSMAGRWLSLLKEIAPATNRAAMLYNPVTAPYADTFRKWLEAAAPPLGIKLETAPVQDEDGIDPAFAALAGGSAGAVVPSDAFTLTHAQAIIAIAARHRVPAVYAFEVFPANGGLASYGVDLNEEMRQAATYVDRVLSGDKPGDLAVILPGKFTLALNLKTATALGLAIPPGLRSRADEVFE